MPRIFAQKTNYAFWQTISMVIIAIGAMFFLSLKAYRLSGLYLAVLIHKIKDACGCENMAQFFAMHPDIFRAAILFGVGIGIFIVYSLYKLVKLISRTKKHNAYYLSFATARHLPKLKAAAKVLNLNIARIIEINAPKSIVFCFGFWQPKICISRVLIKAMSKNELKAILAHEAQHMNSFEPLKLFAVKYFRSIFFFLPGLKTSVKKYITLSELAADEKASGNFSERSSLASAILKISEQEELQRKTGGASLFFSGLAMEERANRLGDGSYEPEFKFIDRSLIAGSLGLAAISFLAIFVFSSSTKAFEMHNIAQCVAPASRESDPSCSATSNQNIFNAIDNNFKNTDNINLGQHSACEAN